MGEFYERKRKGLCTKCGINPATGTRMILCDKCRDKLHTEHEKGTEPVKYYGDYPH